MSQTRSTASVVGRLVLLVVGMFGFGFALVPLYEVFCEVTGIQDRDQLENASVATLNGGVDESREITVQFVVVNGGTMPWEFRPDRVSVKLHPGEPFTTSYLAHNGTARQMTAQAIPSVSPGKASLYFHKTECFCFEQQTLAAGESVDMPLRFVVDPELPDDIHTITLAYSIYDITADAAPSPVAAATKLR